MTIKNKLTKTLFSVLLSIALMLEVIMPSVMISFAATGNEYAGGAGNAVSDRDTSTKYSESLGDNASTEYAGRVWTDRSVYTDDVTFDTFGGGQETITLNAGDNLGEDFLVAYSALATSMSVSGQSHSPVDVVLILDISGSMSNQSSNMDNNKSRIYNAVQAANTAIDSLMEMNPYNRVAVVAFSSTAQTLLSLDRYTKTASNVSYFTLSGETGSSNNATLYTRAIGAASGTIEKNTSVSGGTNIQMGLYQGMNLLANETSTKANINGTNIQRTPSVILLSDGAPTFSSDSRSWWAPSNNDDDGPGDDAYAGNGMKAILTGSYMKKAIDRNYGVANTSFATTVYTVGMGITNLSGSQKNLAYMTLDPGTYWNDNTSNTMKTTIKNYWSSYTANNNTGTLNINVGTSGFFSSTDKNYYLTHPTTGYDVDAVDGYDYVDDYYDADNASAITTVFDEIVANINISSPQVPTEIKGDNPLTDGYITYTDPIGEYMEVKDVKAIIYAGQKFTAKNVATNGNTTTYTFSGIVDSAVYGHQELNNIIITVEKEASGNEVITIKIPAAVIPLRVNSVLLNEDGSVKTHTNNGAFPARIIYSIGLQSEIVKQADDGSYYIDKSKISAEYLAQNTTADGNINFYSSLYSNSKTVNGSTVGDATIEFEPSHTNGFYYILEDMPIYKDPEFKNQVPASESLDDDTVYYYKDEYYHGNSTEVAAIARTGAQLKRTEIKTGADGYLYRAEGSPRLNRILKFEGTKVQNITQTAEDFYAPTFEHAPGSTDPYEGKFVIYLGNNGVLSLAAGGNLKISKTVNASNGTTAPDATFEFTIDLNGSNVNGGTYDYTISNADGAVASTGTVSAANPKVYLKDSQTATIFSLPPNTTYQVTETAVAGFTSYSEGATGTIQNGSTAVAEFTNTYNVTPITFPVNNDLGGTKVLTGRNWQVGTDSFTFLIRPYNNAPLPDGYDAVNGITVNQPNTTVNGDDAATFEFGTIEFTAPGVYRYTIAEQEPENDAYLPGISYSRALYRLVVTVTDNGDGTLSADAEIQKLYDDSANPLFTYVNNEIVMNAGQEDEDAIVFVNTYVANAVTRVPVATKNYTDNSGQNPLVSGMFEFKLEAIGVVENNTVVPNSISSVPMPTADRFVTTSNEGHNITFPAVSFTQDVIPQGADSITFRYQMSEVFPDVADRVNGMTYDDSVYTIDVVVSIDPNSHELNVSPMYSNDQRVAVFENVYTPTPVSADINGTKTLIGRDMKNNESFEFVLGSNASTGNAIRDGIVVIPANSNVATVTDAKDNVAKAFAFEDITFKKAGTYVFTVSETQGNSLAVEYDDSVITVTIIVDDADKDGNLEIASTTYSNGKNAAEFTNVYSSTFSGNPVSLSGAKELTGKTLLKGEFYFNVEKYYNGTIINQGLVTHTKDVTGNNGVYSGAISFIEDDTYDKEGTYEYYISELIPADKVKGTIYDQSKYRLTVIVEDNLDGSLIITSTKKEISDGSTWSEVSDIVFANTYTPDPTTATLPLINKIISGDRSKPLQDNEFQFELKAVSANPSDGMTLPSATIVSNAANGNIIFDAITFSKAGTYIVSVKEIIPDDANKVAGITYSTQEIVATYRVTDDRNGNLTAVLTQFVGGDDIINRYNPEAAEAQIEISKIFTGRQNNEWLATDSFDFTVSALDDETKQAIANGEIEFPFDNGSTEIATRTIDVKGEKASVNVKINRIGTYKFKVSEVQGNIPGIAYDNNDYDVVIVATDDSDNAIIKLNINNQDTNKIALDFTNTYSVSSTTTALPLITKVISGDRSASLQQGEFEFELTTDAQDGIILPAVTTVSNQANGSIVFDDITFTKVGIYNVYVKEIIPDDADKVAGITYSTQTITAVYTVTDNKDGTLTAALTPIISNSITNTYKADSAEAQIEIGKSFTGRENNEWLATDSFDFTISALDDTTKQAIANGEIEFQLDNGSTDTATKTINAKGQKASQIVKVNKIGTYKFKVSEVQGNIPGVAYDTNDYDVVIVATDDSANAQIKLTINNQDTDKITLDFSNTYSVSSTTAALPLITKVIEGDRSVSLQQGEFKFELTTDAQDGIILPAVTTVSNQANGSIVFDDITFFKPGRYNFYVKEIIPDDADKVAGITYSTQTNTATYTVTDNKDGTLTAALAPISSNIITNTYKADSAEAQIEIGKSFTGRENNEWLATDSFDFTISALDDETKQAIAKGEIEFQLDSGSTDTATKTINAKGQLASHIVKVNKAGTYKFKVSEVQGNIPGVTYDTQTFDIVIVATDDSANAKIKLNINNQNTDKITLDFSNTYSVQSTDDIEFSAVKKVTSPKDNAYSFVGGEFKFTLKDEQGKTIATATNDKNGNIVFDKFVIDAAGTYRYVVYEENTAVKNITYDKTKYIVELTVEDNTTGKLVVTKTVITKENSTDEISKIVFENVYTPEAPATSPDTGVDSTNYMNLLIALFFISTSCLTATLFYGIKKYREE